MVNTTPFEFPIVIVVLQSVVNIWQLTIGTLFCVFRKNIFIHMMINLFIYFNGKPNPIGTDCIVIRFD